MEEYEALRSDATHFAVAPNPSHVFLEVENVVGQTGRYWIVEKTGIAGAVAMHRFARGARSDLY
jgi:hypothetical protein